MQTFKQIQLDFVQHLKDPQTHPYTGGIEQRRIKIYRDLFFNNILGFLNSGFPVLASLYTPKAWETLARQFFAQHNCRSPYFIDISKEFVEYLSSEYELTDSDPVFMQELAHYEWLELDVSVRKIIQPNLVWDGQSIVTQVQLSELASLVSYQYPVQQVNVDFQPTQADEPVYIVVYRDNDDEVNFTQVNPVTAHLINIIQQQENTTVLALQDMMLEAMPQLEAKQVVDSLQQVLQQLLNQQILLPTED
jgi:hypothetical protein